MDERGDSSSVGSILMAGITLVLAATLLVSAQGMVGSEVSQTREQVTSLLANETIETATQTPAGTDETAQPPAETDEPTQTPTDQSPDCSVPTHGKPAAVPPDCGNGNGASHAN